MLLLLTLIRVLHCLHLKTFDLAMLGSASALDKVDGRRRWFRASALALALAAAAACAAQQPHSLPVLLPIVLRQAMGQSGAD